MHGTRTRTRTARTVHQGVSWDLPGPESPQHLCWGSERAALILQETFLGKTKSSKKLQEQEPQEPLTALGHFCWSHRERGTWGDIVPLALPRADWHSTAEPGQSRDRGVTGVSPGSSQQDPAYLYCPKPCLPGRTGVCARRAHLCPRTARGQRQP